MLVLFTPEQNHPEEMEIVSALFEAGLERLHLRKPKANKEEYYNYLKSIPVAYHPQIYLHQFHELKEEFPTISLHQRDQDLEISAYPVKTSGAHSVQEALEKLERFEEIYLSPVFPSISKVGYRSEEDLSLLHLGNDLQDRIIALGGINSKNIYKAKELGFKHFAVLGSVWQSESPLKSFEALRYIL